MSMAETTKGIKLEYRTCSLYTYSGGEYAYAPTCGIRT